MADEWVEMTHPEVGDAQHPVTREAFEQVWKDKGWQIKGETSEPQSRLPNKAAAVKQEAEK